MGVVARISSSSQMIAVDIIEVVLVIVEFSLEASSPEVEASLALLLMCWAGVQSFDKLSTIRGET